MRVTQFEGVANQFLVHTHGGVYFQSYNSMIAFKRNDGQIILDKTYYGYSHTTMKYLKRFLGHDMAETRKRIKDKKYKLVNLN